jgi:hypothetical protein
VHRVSRDSNIRAVDRKSGVRCTVFFRENSISDWCVIGEMELSAKRSQFILNVVFCIIYLN